MNNIVRKAIREEIERIRQLVDACACEIEKQLLNDALVSLVRADYYDFHLNPRKKYVIPKTSFKYEC